VPAALRAAGLLPPTKALVLWGKISGSCAGVGMVVVAMGFAAALSTAFISPRNIPA